MAGVISLGIGEPDFVTPWHIREAAVYSLERGHTGYTSNLGLPKLREQIARYVDKHFGITYDAATEVLVSVGVSEALDLALRALLDPGDEVLYHEPCYVSYSPSIALAHGVPVAVPTRAEDGFALRAGAVAERITPRSKVLMLNFPTNPTGATMRAEELEGIAALCRRHDLIVLTDEIYSELTYDGGQHHVHRRTAGDAGTHHLLARLFQGVRHDRISHRLRLRARAADRGDDEDSPVRHPVRVDHKPGGGHRGVACTATRASKPCAGITRADAISSSRR